VNTRKKRHYAGSEIYLSLVDEKAAPWNADLKQLGVEALCTNRALPLEIIAYKGKVNFTMEEAAPINQVTSLAGPSAPVKAYDEGDHAWRLVNHLSLNYLSLLDNNDREGAMALRELLRLYSHSSSLAVRKQIDGVLHVSSRSVVQRIPGAGPIAFGRGTEIEITCQENAFDGIGIFVLGSVLERFFAKYSSLNSFTQMILTSTERGEVMRWPVRTGTAPLL
jgi:type VI secretion system protein ImpG